MARPRKQVDELDDTQGIELHPGDRLDAACEVLMEYLPVETQERIREAKEGRDVPLWHMILGYVMRCRDREEVWSPHLLSMWDNGLPASAPRPCKNCKKMFTHRFSEASYCCDHCAFEKIPEKGHTTDCPTRTYKEVLA